MVKEQLYTIGEVSKLCNVSAKALRFYDRLCHNKWLILTRNSV